MRRMLITMMFFVVAKKSRTFIGFPYSANDGSSTCAGAGKEHSQAASPSWPMETFHTIGVMFSI